MTTSYDAIRRHWRKQAAARKAIRHETSRPCMHVVEGVRCKRWAKMEVRPGQWFCVQHVAVWHHHFKIIDRIRAIPIRER